MRTHETPSPQHVPAMPYHTAYAIRVNIAFLAAVADTTLRLFQKLVRPPPLPYVSVYLRRTTPMTTPSA